jgi:hypothetical protein
MKLRLILFLFILVSSAQSFGQCAMCRATLENNVSNGNVGIAAGINFGILYLLFAPYAAIGVIAFFWFKMSKSDALKESLKRHLVG